MDPVEGLALTETEEGLQVAERWGRGGAGEGAGVGQKSPALHV